LVQLTQSTKLGEHIKLELDLQQAKLVELSFGNAKHSLKLKIDAVAGQLILDRSNAGIADFETGFASVQRAPLDIKTGVVQLEVFLDTSSIEVFADNGRTVMTSVIFPGEPYTQTKLSADKAISIKRVTMSQLTSIWPK
jgi:fructan beta-fructosidase